MWKYRILGSGDIQTRQYLWVIVREFERFYSNVVEGTYYDYRSIGASTGSVREWYMLLREVVKQLYHSNTYSRNGMRKSDCTCSNI